MYQVWSSGSNAYYRANRIVGIDYYATDGSVIAGVYFVYDPAGRIVRKRRDGVMTYYEYGSGDRLTAERRSFRNEQNILSPQTPYTPQTLQPFQPHASPHGTRASSVHRVV